MVGGMNPCGAGWRQRIMRQIAAMAATSVPSISHGDWPVAFTTIALRNSSADQVSDPPVDGRVAVQSFRRLVGPPVRLSDRQDSDVRLLVVQLDRPVCPDFAARDNLPSEAPWEGEL